MRRAVMNFVLFTVVVVGGLALTRSEGEAVNTNFLCCFSDCVDRCIAAGGDGDSCIESICNNCEATGCHVHYDEVAP